MRFNQSIPIKYRPFVAPLAVLALITVLTLTLGKFAYQKIVDARENIKDLETKNRTLEEKKNILTNLSSADLKKEVKDSVAAVPGDNPSVFALSTIRTLAQENGLAVSDFHVSEVEDPKLAGKRAVQIAFDIQGSFFSTISFLKTLQNSVPLTKVTDIKFSVSGITALAKIVAVSSWGFLPKDLGKTESPVETLTSADRELLGKLGNLRSSVASEVSLSPPAGKTDPFAF